MKKRSTGALRSPYDIRTFTYKPTKGNHKGGQRWEPKDIEDQHTVGICTAISMVMNAQKHYGIRFSPEFQYLMQKRLYDSKTSIGWGEGSSIFHALKVGKNVGFLPIEKWTYTDENDRKLSYSKYIKKLQSIPEKDIEDLIEEASKYKISAYASIPVDIDVRKNALDENGGLLSRFVVSSSWWTKPIEPLKFGKPPYTGHAVNDTNYTGMSFRLANSWGIDWADKGTAYYLWDQYKPTESWAVWYEEIPKEIEKQKAEREAIIGRILDYLQKIIALVHKL